MRINLDTTQQKPKRNVFFTSDFHLFHKNILRFDKRPFDNLEEMHEVILENWNNTVTPDDTVIYLGDLSFARNEEKAEVTDFLNKLNGTIHYVLGNHDRFEDIKNMKRFASVQDYLEVNITHFTAQGDSSQKVKTAQTMFSCMHYPIYSWNKAHHGESWLIHGHCHQNLFVENKQWVLDIEKFSRFIPKEHIDEYISLIKKKNFYDKKAVDVGCMGWDYKPVDYNTILSLKSLE